MTEQGPTDDVSPTGAEPAAPGRTRRRSVASRAGLVLAGAVAAALAVTAPADITVTIDSASSALSTRAATVRTALADADVPVGAEDRVTPALDTPVTDGTHIRVVPARDVRLTLNGTPAVHRVAAATVGAALAELDIPTKDAHVSAPATTRLPRSGFDLNVRTPQQVTLAEGGKVRPVTTTAATVADLLADEEIHPGHDDIVIPHPSAQPRAGQQVRVIKVEVTRTTHRTRIAAPTVTRQSASLPAGQTRVSRAGAAGARTALVTKVLHDGRPVSSKTVTQQTTPPVPRVVLVGTAPIGPSARGHRAATSPRTGGGGLNWAALAQCESGGRVGVVSANGLYHGLYQFSVPTWRAVGGTGLPSQASSAEQLRRAKMLYAKAGRGQWPVCGKLL